MPHPRRCPVRPGVIAAALSALAGVAHALPDAPSDLREGLSSLRTASMTSVGTLGKTREGRDIPLITLGDPATRDTNPAILIVAGLNGDHWIGTDVAMGLAQRLPRDHADLLENTTVYIIPRVNLDAANAHASATRLRMSRATSRTSTDDDKDRRADEDGPEDLNGDGLITQMRVKNPPAYLKATHILDPDTDGLLRPADASKGEVADYAVLTEGIDNDHDGAFNEDGPGGVDLDMNFPHLWPEHAPGAGAYALSEPETLALADFVLDHPNIESVLAFGLHDTLVSIPQSGKTDATGEAPLGIETADKPHYERIGEAFTKATGMNAVSPVVDRDDKGAFWAWAYAHAGTWAFSTPVWVRDDQIKRGDDKEDRAEEKAAPAPKPTEPETPALTDDEIREMIAEYGAADEARQAEMMAEYNALPPAMQNRITAIMEGRTPPASPAPATADAPKPRARGGKGADSDDAKWLALATERGEGFAQWEPYRHPQLGDVEIGGFVPGFQMNPPADQLERLVAEQASFVESLAEELPRLTLDEPTVERVGAGVYRVSIVAHNDGVLPTASALAVKSGVKRPLVLRMEGDEKAVLAGNRVQRESSIAGGGRANFEWLVAGREGSTITITVRSPQTGEREITVALRASEEAGR